MLLNSPCKEAPSPTYSFILAKTWKIFEVTDNQLKALLKDFACQHAQDNLFSLLRTLLQESNFHHPGHGELVVGLNRTHLLGKQ